MATYIDQRDAAITAIQALIAPNGVGAITGQVHQDNEVGQTNDAYLNLVGYDNFGFVIVRTGINTSNGNEDNTSLRNGINLKAAYANAITLTPNGQPLSATNRAAVLLPPGVYDMGNDGFEMDTEFVDIVGLGAPEDIHITSVYGAVDGGGTIIKTCDNAFIKNLTISNQGPGSPSFDILAPSGYAPSGVFPSEVIENVRFISFSTGLAYMRQQWEFAGTYINCTAIGDLISWAMFSFPDGGTFKNCHATGIQHGFGYMAQVPGGTSVNTAGTFENCSCYYGFGHYPETASNGTVSGTFRNCKADSYSFGYNASIINAQFIGCQGGDFCFGSETTINPTSNTGVYRNCIAGSNSFSCGLAAGSIINAQFYNCQGLDNCFNGKSISMVADNCVAQDRSFGYGVNSLVQHVFNGAKISKCKGRDSCFGFRANVMDFGSEFKFCEARNNSFGVNNGGAGQSIASRFYNCVGGSGCFATGVAGPRGTTIGNPVTAIFINCTGNSNCFGAGNGIEFAATCINCRGLSFCFSSAGSHGDGEWPSITGVFYNCIAGVGSFGYAGGTYARVDASGKFYNCVAGNFSFGASEGTGQGPTIADGEFHNCVGGDYSFGAIKLAGGGSTAIANGKFYNCKAGSYAFGCVDGFGAGPEASGEFRNCNAIDYAFGSNSSSTGLPAIYGGANANGLFYKCQGGQACFGSNDQESTTLDAFASGYFEECIGGWRSFAGHSFAKKTGTFIRCVLRNLGGNLAIDDAGPLYDGGLMEDCTWEVSATASPAIYIANDVVPGTPPRIYGGKYVAGATAPWSIVPFAPGVSAAIAQTRSNLGIDPTINNLATAGTTDAEGNFVYSNL